MTRKSIFTTVLVLLLIVSFSISVFAQGVPPMPAYCYGELTIKGQPALLGTLVKAKVDGVERGRLETFVVGWHGRPGLESKLLVSEKTKDELKGKWVRFYVSGVYQGQTFTDAYAGQALYWGSGRGLRIDLTVDVIDGSTDPSPAEYTLNVSTVGLGSTSPSVGNHRYSSGSQVNLSATAQSGWVFEKWVIGSTTITSATTSTVMDTNKTATAYFYQLGVDPAPGDTSPGPTDPSPGTPSPGGTDPADGESTAPEGSQPPGAKGTGDVNSDGKIDINDVNLVMQHVLEIKVLTTEQRKLADVNGDGKIDILDVVLILQYILNLIDSF